MGVTCRRRSGELEGEVLAALWAAPEALVPAEVQAVVGGDLAYTTVTTILVRLHEKGVIERTKVGRAFAYRPLVAETEVVAEQVRRLLDHGADRTAVVRGLLDGLRPGDETLLRAMLADGDRGRTGGRR
ncbi:MAG TPA: BlaI/MecI/CopY family transcriptional regulator [Acidimicrobiales bacterium]|jgi:predicted transcriptional regulator|nr:BlaI/MecI/CopY family transcriptional regulator [Acidimicrobiales bacterium]